MEVKWVPVTEALRNGNQATMEGVLNYIINEAEKNKLYWKRGEFE